MRCVALLSALALLISMPGPLAAQAAPPAPDLSRLTAQHRSDLRCAAAFAIVAMEQSGGDALAGWPPLAQRGKRFFADAGERATKEAGIPREQVRDLIGAEVRTLQTAPDPDKALAALSRPCLARLDATVAPLVTPALRQCAAILGLAFDEVHGREGMSPAAQDLKTLASVLSSREREALIAAGKSGEEADRTLAEARDAILAEADDGKGGVEKYDISHCYDLAKPTEKSHY